MPNLLFRASAFALLLSTAAFAEEPVHLDIVSAIREEGLHHSKVMDIALYLTDVIGPRLTNSPQQREAAEWVRQQFDNWGLKNAELEAWGDFGRGWSFEHATIHMVRPQHLPLFALPKAWTPGTNGPAKGLCTRVTIKTVEDFEKYRGKLAGKILLLDEARSPKDDTVPVFKRHTGEDLCKLEEFPIPDGKSGDARKEYLKTRELQDKTREFLASEKPLAAIELSSRDNGIVRAMGSRSYKPGQDPGPPVLCMITEHYNRLVRFVEDEGEVELEIDIKATFHEEETLAYNVVAELPGTSKSHEIVMLGGHLDSWHGGTGATDNAAGVSVAMEAVRILKAIGAKPKRTIRVALWTGEEQGLLGSRGYVKKHFASRPEPTDPEQLALPEVLREPTWPLRTTRAHDKFCAYFNLDNGSGKIRGIYAQENSAVVPIFTAWLAPFNDLGADTVTLQTTGSTDHVPFDDVGLPGFQFIQDPLEYFTRTHHTNLDVYDRLQRDDLMQSATIMASFVYHAAMRDEPLPRKPMPRERAVPVESKN